VYSTIEQDGFRVPAPVAARDGRWLADGWAAWQWIPGEPLVAGRYAERLSASAAFHRALRAYDRPAFLDRRQDPWSVADRIVFERLDWQPHPRLAPALDRLWALLEPIALPEQVIHGDITQNLLDAPGLPLAVIDFSPYWRPARFADAILVVDAIVWEGAPFAIAQLPGLDHDFRQLLVRAALRRLYEVDCHHRLRNLRDTYLDQVDAYAGLIAWLERPASG
jgi:Ser/Thr protein kinase RdoA (MazF antagonist)